MWQLGLKNPTVWKFEEVITALMGRCWMVCYQKEIQAVEFPEDTSFLVNTRWNYQVDIRHLLSLAVFRKIC